MHLFFKRFQKYLYWSLLCIPMSLVKRTYKENLWGSLLLLYRRHKFLIAMKVINFNHYYRYASKLYKHVFVGCTFNFHFYDFLTINRIIHSSKWFRFDCFKSRASSGDDNMDDESDATGGMSPACTMWRQSRHLSEELAVSQITSVWPARALYTRNW